MAKREAHPTKKGPGRRHAEVKHGAAPVPPKGGAWFGQHTNPAANVRRAVKAEIGARQYRKQRKAFREVGARDVGVAEHAAEAA